MPYGAATVSGKRDGDDRTLGSVGRVLQPGGDGKERERVLFAAASAAGGQRNPLESRKGRTRDCLRFISLLLSRHRLNDAADRLALLDFLGATLRPLYICSLRMKL